MTRFRSEPDARSRSAALGRIWCSTKSTAKAPFSTFPTAAIISNARLIRQLFHQIRRVEQRDQRSGIYQNEVGRIDLSAAAVGLDLDTELLKRQIALRRRQTARLSYCSFGLGCLFLVFWVWQEYASRMSGTHLVGALEFIPFVAIFYLVAFKNAYINWQLRTGQFGSAADYLRSPAPFLPH